MPEICKTCFHIVIEFVKYLNLESERYSCDLSHIVIRYHLGVIRASYYCGDVENEGIYRSDLASEPNVDAILSNIESRILNVV